MDLRGLIEIDKFLYAYLIFKFLDFVFGFARAYIKEGFKSAKLRTGLVNCGLEILLIIFAGVLDQLLMLDILSMSVKVMFVFKEALSILENAGQCGIELPQILKDKIYDLNPNKDKEDK